VRSIGYSIYYTMVNIGGAAGPLYASWAHKHMGVENVYRIAAASVFVMFFVVLIFFREPKKAGDAPPPTIGQVARNFCTVLGNYKLVLPVIAVAIALGIYSLLSAATVPWWIWVILAATALAGISKFMWFLVIFTGYWVVFWQQYISFPGYLVKYANAPADVAERLISVDGITVILFTVALNLIVRKLPPLIAVIVGTVITSLAWVVLAIHPTLWGAGLSIFVLAIGEITQQPPYYEYISKLAPPGQQGTYMGFAFLPIGIGSLIGGWFGGRMFHHFGEVQGKPQLAWYAITGVGLLTAVALLIYNQIIAPKTVKT
jgi:MFS family permease